MTPSLTATSDELLGIARAMGATGKGVFQAVADLDDLQSEFAILRSMAETARRPLSITTLQRAGQPVDAYRRLLELVDRRQPRRRRDPQPGRGPARSGSCSASRARCTRCSCRPPTSS